MRRLTVVTLVLFLTAGVAFASRAYEVKKKAGDYQVVIRIDRNPPVVGDNPVSIEVNSAEGTPVKDAKVKLDYSMPPMPGMPPMSYKAEAEHDGEVYRTRLAFSMAGSWSVGVKIAREGKTSSLKFSVDVK